MKIKIQYRIGHGAYRGANRPHKLIDYPGALAELMRRGVLMEVAHRALQAAKSGSHATMTTMYGSDVIEVVRHTWG